MLEKENAFYLAHQAEFHEKYLNKWLVIYGEELFGAYDTLKEVVETALPHFCDKDILLHRPADDGTVIEIGPIIDDGKNIIGMGDFAVSNTDRKTSFSFAMPPFPDRINFLEKAKTV